MMNEIGILREICSVHTLSRQPQYIQNNLKAKLCSNAGHVSEMHICRYNARK